MCEVISVCYQILLYVYILFKEVSVIGVFFVWFLWMEFFEDEVIFVRDDEFLLGLSLLVYGVYFEVGIVLILIKFVLKYDYRFDDQFEYVNLL